MKKLLAILLSVLMLFSVIPFAAVSVSAADETAVELVVEETELNAGDELVVEVYLQNIPDPGLIGALIEVEFDNDVFELATYFDEDEETWVAPIEVGPKYSASSNKYIMFSPIDEETGAMDRCLVKYMRALASASQTRKEALFYTVTFKVKDDAISGDYTLSVKDSTQNLLLHGNVELPLKGDTITITVNGQDPEPPVCEHEWSDATCTDPATCSKCGETDGEALGHTYLYACDQYCNECGEKSNPGAKHIITHVEAKEAVSCIEYGNIEYWRCESCGAVWKDADGRYQTNMMSILVAAECVSNAPACQDGECVNCGLPCYAEAEHTYANAHDASCDVCGTIRELVLKAEDIIIAGGTSVSEKKNGLAFKLDAAINGITWNEEYTADYSNATVTIEGVEYKLVGMGVIANNKGYESQTAEDVDGKYVLNVPAVKVYEDAEGNTSYSIRVLNIPADKLDAEITVRSYYQYEVDGEIVTVYGQDWTSSYNDAR